MLEYKVSLMRSISFLLTVIFVLLSNFEVHFSPRYGNCFSFNSNVSGSLESLWSSTRPGSLMGLNVVLNTQQSVYMRSSVHHARDQRPQGPQIILLSWVDHC